MKTIPEPNSIVYVIWESESVMKFRVLCVTDHAMTDGTIDPERQLACCESHLGIKTIKVSSLFNDEREAGLELVRSCRAQMDRWSS